MDLAIAKLSNGTWKWTIAALSRNNNGIGQNDELDNEDNIILKHFRSKDIGVTKVVIQNLNWLK
jgi:hypothetical protein